MGYINQTTPTLSSLTAICLGVWASGLDQKNILCRVKIQAAKFPQLILLFLKQLSLQKRSCLFLAARLQTPA
jgi:hypothetical protein